MNRRGDIPIAILSIGVVLVCSIALFSFFNSTIKMRNNFVGIGLVEQLNSQIEDNYVNEKNSANSNEDINKIIAYAKQNTVVGRTCNCRASCDNFANWISQSSSKNGIEPIILFSLMMQESDCTSKASSGSSVGLMQINLINCGSYGLPSDKDECKKQLINNPQLNIEIGAEILKDKYNAYGSGKIFVGCSRTVSYSGWEAALRGYNGWGCGKDILGNKIVEQDNYVEEVVRRSEALKGNYAEKETTSGLLWFKKKTVSFSVEFQQ